MKKNEVIIGSYVNAAPWNGPSQEITGRVIGQNKSLNGYVLVELDANVACASGFIIKYNTDKYNAWLRENGLPANFIINETKKHVWVSCNSIKIISIGYDKNELEFLIKALEL